MAIAVASRSGVAVRATWRQGGGGPQTRTGEEIKQERSPSIGILGEAVGPNTDTINELIANPTIGISHDKVHPKFSSQ